VTEGGLCWQFERERSITIQLELVQPVRSFREFGATRVNSIGAMNDAVIPVRDVRTAPPTGVSAGRTPATRALICRDIGMFFRCSPSGIAFTSMECALPSKCLTELSGRILIGGGKSWPGALSELICAGAHGAGKTILRFRSAGIDPSDERFGRPHNAVFRG
jgi:hypothetical protein